MSETLPKVIAEYLQTRAGKIMLEGAVWFRWNLNDRRIDLTQPAAKLSVPGTLAFVREGKGQGDRRKRDIHQIEAKNVLTDQMPLPRLVVPF